MIFLLFFLDEKEKDITFTNEEVFFVENTIKSVLYTKHIDIKSVLCVEH